MAVIDVVLDVDGTLVDSVYQHAVAWHRAFQEHDIDVSAAEAHAHVGMGGDQLVPALAGDDVEKRLGDALRARHDELYADEIASVRPLRGAKDLLERLAAEGRRVVLSSSAKADEVEHHVDLLAARDLVVGWTTSADVDRTKPSPDLVQVALGMLGNGSAVMVGDSPWDVRAALAASIPALGVTTGGFGRETLARAGARAVADDLDGVAAHLACARSRS